MNVQLTNLQKLCDAIMSKESQRNVFKILWNPGHERIEAVLRAKGPTQD